MDHVARAFACFVVGWIVAGCSTTAYLYPVSGPLSKSAPPPVLTANVNGITGNTGTGSLVLPDGETCDGRWSSAAPNYSSSVSGTLWGLYGSVVGFSGTATGIAPGVNRGEAFFVCGKGTTIKAEFFTGSGTANGYGVAEDNRGNVYRMIF